ncbi:hypothetical protein CRUP_033629 [Coryphaenoides rupestris]|nr:hypothetical protein CRUP_033629 [Coryphaenoides rupestris]
MKDRGPYQQRRVSTRGSRMRLLLGVLVLLSRDGEKLVEEEVKKALYAVKEMKEVMRSNELKHGHLMQSLRRSGEKQEGAAQLTQEVTEQLQEAEEQCRDSLQSEWEQCRPQTDAEEVARIEASFGQLMRRVGPWWSGPGAGWTGPLRGAFLGDEREETASATPGPLDPARVSGFLQGVGLEEVLDSFYDFGRSVAEEFGGRGGRQGRGLFPRYLHNRQLCRDLRRQTSECWQLQDRCETCQGPLLKECPSVRELHMALGEASQLLEVAREQYREILSVVQRHSDQTVRWLGNMAARCSWVAPETPATAGAGNGSSGSSTAGNRPWDVFRITTVSGVLPKSSAGVESAHASETEVQVYILNSPPIVLSVPGELSIQGPGFLQYVTQEALGKYKVMVRIEDE